MVSSDVFWQLAEQFSQCQLGSFAKKKGILSERQKTAFGLFLENSGLSCKVKAFAFDAAVTRNVIKSNLALVSGLEAQNQGKINLIPSYQ